MEFILADCKLEMYTIRSGKAFLLCDETREGSEHDVKIIERLFQTNGFENPTVSKAENKEKVMTEFTEFKDKLPGDVDCLMVVIMCHGRLGHISLSNGEEIQLETIYQLFNNSQCPALREKPKLFVVQACRGVDKKDKTKPYVDGSAQYYPSTPKLLPTESDIMVVYAVCPEKLAIIHPDYGCPLFEEMEKVFEDFSNSHHMYELFTQVNGRLDIRMENQGFTFDEQEKPDKSTKAQLIHFDQSIKSDIGRSLHIVSSLTKKWYLLTEEREGEQEREEDRENIPCPCVAKLFNCVIV
ncbi:caspase-14-like [Salmo trutta]|uniref:caspase-14-like n=1 Tax=Salmo trutta TaxID=8032 RepID=UPI00113132F4|nr:caspase-14-like [Salmo trutta]